MKSDNILVRFIVNGLAGAVVGAVLLGLLGAIFAGGQGFINGAVMGAALGLVGGLSSLGMLESTFWFTGLVTRYGRKYLADEPEE
ncbi:MAG: hypothetical protein IPM53_06225 [Anaerolineaceae bacterium]|nr:hypothetical protein [Anaerolineaceae bacterium]